MQDADRPEETADAIDGQQLDVHTRLKLARTILDKTVRTTGSGYLLMMWVPGTDKIYRSYSGVDTPQEAIALCRDVTETMKERINQLTAPIQPKHNDA